jgi:hypothetical protein
MRKTTTTVLRDIYNAWRIQDLEWLASYLPEGFSHAVYIPAKVHPLGGLCTGKQDALQRLRLIAIEFDFLSFDASKLMVDKHRAAVEIPVRYRHRETGVRLEAVFANFWTFEGDWPVRLSEYHDIGRIQAFAKTVAAVTAGHRP